MSTKDKWFETGRQMLALPLTFIVMMGCIADIITTWVFMRSGAFPHLEEGNPIAAALFDEPGGMADFFVLKIIIAAGLCVAGYQAYTTRKASWMVGGTFLLAFCGFTQWQIVVSNLRYMGVPL